MVSTEHPSQTKPNAKRQSARAGLKFLIVDPDQGFVEGFSQAILQSCGAQGGVFRATKVADALAWMTRHDFDVCFLDYDTVFGSDNCTALFNRLNAKVTAAVVLSKQASKVAAMRALDKGAKDFLIKSRIMPFDVAKSVSYALFWRYREIELMAVAQQVPQAKPDPVPMFGEHLHQALEVARRGRERVGLLMIGLTGMDPVYQDYGSEVSAQLLEQVGQRISSQVRATDVVAQLGDKEFGTILVKVDSKAVVKMLSGKLAGEIANKPYTINGYTLKIGAAVGASTFPDDAENLNDMQDLAQKARAKAEGQHEDRNSFRPFNYY